MLGKLTRSPSPTAGAQHHPPPSAPPQQFQTRQVQPQRQSNENSWAGGQQQPGPHSRSAHTESMARHASQSLPPGAQRLQGRGSPPTIPPEISSKQLPQAPGPQQQPPQQQFMTRQSSEATIKPPQQSQQPQYESVPIPTGYGHLQGEYDAGQGQFFHQSPLQQGNRHEYPSVDPRGGGRVSIDRHSLQVSESQLSIDRRTISPNLSRQGTQASQHTYGTARSLSPPISDGPRSMTPVSETGQFGRQSLREGSLLGHQTPVHLSPGPSVREEPEPDSQRYQQLLPLPQSISQVQNATDGYERSPSPQSVPLPVSPPHLQPPFSPPPVQVRSEALTSLVVEESIKSPSPPPPPPPKEEIERQPAPVKGEIMQKGKQATSFYDSESPGNTETPNTRVASPVPPPSASATTLSPAPATEDKTAAPTQKDEDTEKEAVDFSTEKIAVNLDLYGPGSKKNGEESEDDYVMSSTSYPGQAWEPSYYGWS